MNYYNLHEICFFPIIIRNYFHLEKKIIFFQTGWEIFRVSVRKFSFGQKLEQASAERVNFLGNYKNVFG